MLGSAKLVFKPILSSLSDNNAQNAAPEILNFRALWLWCTPFPYLPQTVDLLLSIYFLCAVPLDRHFLYHPILRRGH